MIKGRTVRVELRDRSARDSFGNDVESYLAPEVVGNVVVQPGACAELDSSRPEGVKVALTLHWPKTWDHRSLRGARVTIDALPYAGEYHVVGDPKPFDPDFCPTDWDMPVEVEAVDG